MARKKQKGQQEFSALAESVKRVNGELGRLSSAASSFGALLGSVGGVLGRGTAGAVGTLAAAVGGISQVRGGLGAAANLASETAFPVFADYAAQNGAQLKAIRQARENLGNLTAENRAFQKTQAVTDELGRAGEEVDPAFVKILADLNREDERTVEKNRRVVEDEFAKSITGNDKYKVLKDILNFGGWWQFK